MWESFQCSELKRHWTDFNQLFSSKIPRKNSFITQPATKLKLMKLIFLGIKNRSLSSWTVFSKLRGGTEELELVRREKVVTTLMCVTLNPGKLCMKNFISQFLNKITNFFFSNLIKISKNYVSDVDFKYCLGNVKKERCHLFSGDSMLITFSWGRSRTCHMETWYLGSLRNVTFLTDSFKGNISHSFKRSNVNARNFLKCSKSHFL